MVTAHLTDITTTRANLEEMMSISWRGIHHLARLRRCADTGILLDLGASKVQADLMDVTIFHVYLQHLPSLQWCAIDLFIRGNSRAAVLGLPNTKDISDLTARSARAIDFQHPFCIERWCIQELVRPRYNASVLSLYVSKVGPNQTHLANRIDLKYPPGIQRSAVEISIGSLSDAAVLAFYRTKIGADHLRGDTIGVYL